MSSSQSQWVSLTKAAARLNVHPATLRRWADDGQIACMLTPGGHRRFLPEDLDRFEAERRQIRRPAPIATVWAQEALNRTRRDVAKRPDNQQWMTQIDSSLREKHRLLGQQLLGLTLQFVSAEENSANDEALLEQARTLGRAYGEIGQSTDMPLTDALQATLFFRDRLMEVALQLPQTTKVSPEANLKLMRRITTLLNVVQLALAEVYETA